MKKTFHMRIFAREAGGHTHLAIWSGYQLEGAAAPNFGKAGELTLTNEEFAAWKFGRMEIEFVSFLASSADSGANRE